jgi:hypothetical protein
MDQAAGPLAAQTIGAMLRIRGKWAEQVHGASGSTEGQAEHQDRRDNALRRGQAEQIGQRQEDDPYVKAWVAWKERYERERKEKSERLEKRKKLENSWNMVKLCGIMIKENYSNWKERRVTENERKEMEEMEKIERLEKQRMKKEKFQANMKKIGKEEIFLKRIEMKEIKENAWKWRGEEHPAMRNKPRGWKKEKKWRKMKK